MATARRGPCRSPSRHPPASYAKPSRFPPPATAQPPVVHADCRGCLTITYQLSRKQLQVTVEIARHTDAVHLHTAIGWAARIDDCSRRLLTNALRAAAHPDTPARLPVFAAAARDLFSHTANTLPPNPIGRSRHRTRYPARGRPSNPCIAEANGLHAELLTAIDALRTAALHRPRVTITERAAADRFLPDASPALQELYALFFTYLEHALQPLEPLVTRAALRAFILETRHELDALTARHTLRDVYTETLTISESDDNIIRLEAEAPLGITGA